MNGGHVTEATDISSIGKIFYTILTGLIPYYHKSSTEEAFKAIVDGEEPYVDPRYRNRSIIERRLVEIMEKCWKHDEHDRPTISEVIQHLRETARLANVSSKYLAKV